MRSLDIIIQPDIDTKERKDIREKEEFIAHVIFILLLVYGLFSILKKLLHEQVTEKEKSNEKQMKFIHSKQNVGN